MGYWIASFALIAFGILGAMSIGLPFLLIGLAMLVLSPIRHRSLAFWPIFLGFVSFNLACEFAPHPPLARVPPRAPGHRLTPRLSARRHHHRQTVAHTPSVGRAEGSQPP